MLKIFFFIFISFLSFNIYTQDKAIGGWVDYSSYRSVSSVVSANGYMYGLTHSGLIEYNISDHSFLRFSKVEGLSDISISCFGYNDLLDVLVVGYQNGKIDLVSSGEIYSVQDFFFKRFHW